MDQFPRLSDREWEVVNHLQQGKSNKLIASSLGISERTVEFHLKNIYDKFQVSSRVELVLKLGDSTVADKVKLTENGERLKLSSWAASLKEAISNIGVEQKMTTLLNSNALDEGTSMTFFEAIRVCLVKKYAEFNGRATRPEFWWFTLFIVLVASALVYISEILGSVFLIAILLPFLAAGARRLHDIGKSGWWLMFLLAPVGGIIILGFMWALPPDQQPEDTLPA
jgi:DNA-binding CsgD family transcriptional regulator